MTNVTATNLNWKVCLIEDNSDLRADLVRLLHSSGYEVVEYDSACAFMQNELGQFSGVVVSDMVMSGMTGLECQAELNLKGINLPFIFISGESSNSQIISAMKNRAVDFLLKPFTKNELLSAIERAFDILDDIKKVRLSRLRLEKQLLLLSPREREVFYMLIKGFSNQEIVVSLEISLSTAKQYKSEVMRKMQVKTLSALMELEKNY